MSLTGALSIASGGLANINYQLGIVSNNVANASTPDYAAETANQESVTAGSQPMGVRTEAATRAINLAMQQAAFQQGTAVSDLTTTTTSLQTIDSVLGTPGQGNDLGSLLGTVQNAFSSLLGDPSNGALQQEAVTSAGNLTDGINTLATTYTQQRQAAENDITSAVSSANTALATIGSLSNQIIAARVAGLSSADLENQRDAAVHQLSGFMGLKTLNQPNGDLIVTTASGTQLPTRATPGPLSVSGATIGPGASYPAAISGIMLNGADITTQIHGGQIGADIVLRDKTLPTFQSELDEFSYQLASRFSGQGLTLFSAPDGTVPTGGGTPAQAAYVGFSAEIQVNPAVTATPSLVRDGTQAVAGSATGPSAFTPNPAGGPAGFATLISRILTYAMGASAQPGVQQPASATSGLGPNGDLAAPYMSPATLADNATALVTAQAAVSGTASNQLIAEQTVATTLNNALAATAGVNMDMEMSHMIQLQNAYGANARIISAVQSMFSQLLQAVP